MIKSKFKKIFVFITLSCLLCSFTIQNNLFTSAKIFELNEDTDIFLPVYVQTALSEGITEDFSEHWIKNTDGSVQRINDNGSEVDLAESQASLYVKDTLVKYFEMQAYIKLGDISGLTGFLFGTWNINTRFTGGSEAFYITKDKKVGLWGSHLGGPGGELESGLISNISLTEYNKVKLRVEKTKITITINDVKAFEINVSENSIFEGRVGIFTTKTNSYFKDITINELTESGEITQDTVRKTIEKVNFEKEEITANLADKNLSLNYTLSPSDSYNKEVFFCVENPEIAGIDNQGKLIFYSAGFTTVFIYTKDGMIEDKLFLTIEEEKITMKALSLNVDKITLKAGETANLIAIVEPLELENYTLRWSSSDTGVVMVNNGKLTAIKAGEATIILKDSNRQFETECYVTVVAEKNKSSCSNNMSLFVPCFVITVALILIVGGKRVEKN